MNLVIDIGNTKVKAAVFELDTIKVAYVFDEVNFFEELEYILVKHEITQCILSSVKETRLRGASIESSLADSSEHPAKSDSKHSVPVAYCF